MHRTFRNDARWRIYPKVKILTLLLSPCWTAFLTFVSGQLAMRNDLSLNFWLDLIRSMTIAVNGLLWFVFSTVADVCNHVDRKAVTAVAACVTTTTWSHDFEEIHAAPLLQIQHSRGQCYLLQLFQQVKKLFCSSSSRILFWIESSVAAGTYCVLSLLLLTVSSLLCLSYRCRSLSVSFFDIYLTDFHLSSPKSLWLH